VHTIRSDTPTARKKAITKFIMVKSQTTRKTRQQCSNSPGMRESKTWESKKLRGKGRKKRKFEEGSGDQFCKTNVTPQWMQIGQC
jgi:hypothetical protein